MTPLIPAAGALAVFKGEYANYKLTPAGIAALTSDAFRFVWPSRGTKCIESLQSPAQ